MMGGSDLIELSGFKRKVGKLIFNFILLLVCHSCIVCH